MWTENVDVNVDLDKGELVSLVSWIAEAGDVFAPAGRFSTDEHTASVGSAGTVASTHPSPVRGGRHRCRHHSPARYAAALVVVFALHCLERVVACLLFIVLCSVWKRRVRSARVS